jgi:ferrous iron transport protein B
VTTALLMGSPNSGKSLMFNRLTGLQQKVANYPGVTVSIKSGTLRHHHDITISDFPGTYSLSPISEEEKVAVENFRRLLQDRDVDLVLCLVDATRMEKSLLFALQVARESQRHGIPVGILANMKDELDRHGIALDTELMEQVTGVPVFGVSGRTGEGLDAVEARLLDTSLVPSRDSLRGLSDSELQQVCGSLIQRLGIKGDLLVRNQTRLDRFFLQSVTGGIAFAAIMYLLFQSIFTWAAPVMDGVEALVGWTADLVVPMIPNQIAADFVADALFGGIGAFLVFVPQIFVLTVIVGILEDSGYMARAALICHRPLRFFGLTGKSFVPMLSGVACAIPGIYAARAIESPRRRLLTYLAIPLMPCSARLPVYTLLIAAFIPANTVLFGLVGLQGLAMFILYFFGIFTGLLVTAFVSRAGAKAETDLPFILEMPPYRVPAIRPLLRGAFDRSRHFITKAGVIIFWVTVSVWVLAYFPNLGADIGESWLGHLGRWIEPVFQPLGLNWYYAVAILSSFLAREVFVGTLGALFGIAGATEQFEPLARQIQDSGLTAASGFALLVLFAIALQCSSTLALLGRESHSAKLPAAMFVAYALLAYALAWIVFQIASFLL